MNFIGHIIFCAVFLLFELSEATVKFNVSHSSKLYPYGQHLSDRSFHNVDGVEVTWKKYPALLFPFLGKNFSSLKISASGLIGFGDEQLPFCYAPQLPINESFTRQKLAPLLSPYWAYADLRANNAKLFLRLIIHPKSGTLRRGAAMVNSYFNRGMNFFLPTHGLLVTWDNVTFFGGSHDTPTNTFQALLLSDNKATYPVVKYANVSWVVSVPDGGDPSSGMCSRGRSCNRAQIGMWNSSFTWKFPDSRLPIDLSTLDFVASTETGRHQLQLNAQYATCTISHDPHVRTFENKRYNPQPHCDCTSYALELVGQRHLYLSVQYKTEPACTGSESRKCTDNLCPGTQIRDVSLLVRFLKDFKQPMAPDSHITIHMFKDPYMDCGYADVHFAVDCSWCSPKPDHPLQRDTPYNWCYHSSNWCISVYEMSLSGNWSTIVSVTLTTGDGAGVLSTTFRGFDRGCKPLGELALNLYTPYYSPPTKDYNQAHCILGICNYPIGGHMMNMKPDNATCWDVKEKCSSCQLSTLGRSKKVQLSNKTFCTIPEKRAEQVCSILTAVPGPFANCLDNSSITKKYAEDEQLFCKLDICMIGSYEGQNISDFVCPYASSLAQKCITVRNIPVPWRNETFCALTCGANAHFNASASSCPATCANPYAPEHCLVPAESACQCNDSYLLDYSGACVKPDDCGCIDSRGQYHMLNSTWANHDCSLVCNCTKKNRSTEVICKAYPPCLPNSACNITRNNRTCYCENGYKRQNDTCIQIDTCSSMDCGNGTCFSFFPEAMCLCPEGFIGPHCEIQRNLCEIPFICANNGTCISSFNNYTCVCPPEFTGRKCELSMKSTTATTTTTPALNTTTLSGCGYCINGTCEDTAQGGHICVCNQGYTGVHCDTPVIPGITSQASLKPFWDPLIVDEVGDIDTHPITTSRQECLELENKTTLTILTPTASAFSGTKVSPTVHVAPTTTTTTMTTATTTTTPTTTTTISRTNLCKAVYWNYQGTGINVKRCLVWSPRRSSRIVYWFIWRCVTWQNAKQLCAIGEGQLASFPTESDQNLLPLLVTPFRLGPRSPSCSSSSYYINGVWIGLSRSSSSTTIWKWTTGELENESMVEWNPRIGYDQNSPRLDSTGNCAFVGWSVFGIHQASHENGFTVGWLKASCAISAKALCMKKLP